MFDFFLDRFGPSSVFSPGVQPVAFFQKPNFTTSGRDPSGGSLNDTLNESLSEAHYGYFSWSLVREKSERLAVEEGP